MTNPVNPKRVLLVLAPLLFASFFIGGTLAARLTEKAAPYLVFGTGGRGLTVVNDVRGSTTFSNGTVIHGIRLLPLDLAWIFLTAIFVLGLLFVSIRIAAWFIRWRNPAFADALQHFWKLNK